MKENLVSILISFVFLTYYAIYSTFASPKIIFFDVGQGDSMLYVDGNFEILVDGGGNDILFTKIGKYIPYYDRKIEVVVLTHWHLDHYSGLFPILRNYEIEDIVLPTSICNHDREYGLFHGEVREIIKKYRPDLSLRYNNMRTELANFQKAKCVNNQDEINNSSVVSKIERGGYRILNMGDTQSDREMEYVIDGVDVLKTGHHCSDTSSSLFFLKSVKPKYAICSFGENSYGHPSPLVLSNFKELGIIMLDTKSNGDIILNLNSGMIYNEEGKLIGEL